MQDGPERVGDSVRAVHPAHAQGAAGAGVAARRRAPDRLPRGHTARQDEGREYIYKPFVILFLPFRKFIFIQITTYFHETQKNVTTYFFFYFREYLFLFKFFICIFQNTSFS